MKMRMKVRKNEDKNEFLMIVVVLLLMPIVFGIMSWCETSPTFLCKLSALIVIIALVIGLIVWSIVLPYREYMLSRKRKKKLLGKKEEEELKKVKIAMAILITTLVSLVVFAVGSVFWGW